MITSESLIAAAIKEAAPMYEAFPILQTFLSRNGVAIGQGSGSDWMCLDTTKANRGKRLGHFDNLSLAIEFAFVKVKENIQNEAKAE